MSQLIPQINQHRACGRPGPRAKRAIVHKRDMRQAPSRARILPDVGAVAFQLPLAIQLS